MSLKIIPKQHHTNPSIQNRPQTNPELRHRTHAAALSTLDKQSHDLNDKDFGRKKSVDKEDLTDRDLNQDCCTIL